MALPTASTPGYALYRKRVTCDCLAEWLHYLELMAIKRGIIKYELDFLQLTGGLKQSGNTHSQGGAFDVKQTGSAFVQLCREMGAPATWSRYNMPIGDNPNHHTHGVLNGCPHNGPARYQLAAQFARCNGLGFMGMGGKDPYPAVWPRRTWQEGIAWARVELGLAPAPAKPKTVTVQKGQTLGKIAAALGVTLAALVLANPQIKNPDLVTPGQTITVPANGGQSTPKPTATPKPTVTPKPSTPAKPAQKPVVLTKWSAKYLHAGARNRTVVSYEKALAAYLGSAKAKALGLTGSVVTDGYYGTATSAATKAAYRKLGVTPNATEPGPSLLAALVGKPKAATNPAPKATTVTRVDASKLHKGITSRHVTTYQRALRAYVGAATAKRVNPAGVTGYYGAQTQALTKAAYRKLGATPNATEPGPGLLAALGLR